MDSKKFLTGIIIATVIITIMGGTLAYWNWQSTNSQKKCCITTKNIGFNLSWLKPSCRVWSISTPCKGIEQSHQDQPVGGISELIFGE